MSNVLTKRPTNTRFDDVDTDKKRYMHTANGGIGTSYASPTRTGSTHQDPIITCSATEVAFIDRIIINCSTGDGVANVNVTMEINGVDCVFHFVSADDTARNKVYDLRPVGNMVVNPSQTVRIKCGTITWSDAEVEYRKYTLSEAYRLGLLDGGTIPSVASTNSITGSGTSSGTAKKIVDCPAGYQIRVLGFYHTGHNYNTAADSSALGFWEETGTFYTPPATKATTAHMVCVAHARGANEGFAPNIFVDDTEGCIEGPEGYSLYIQQSANIAGATPAADFVVMYQLVQAQHGIQSTTLTTALTGGTETSIVVADSIFPDVPSIVTVNVIADDGTVVTATSSSWTSKTFTVASTDFSSHNASVGAKVTFKRLLSTVNDPRGSTAQSIVRPKKWWASTVAAATSLSNPATDATNPVFSTYASDNTDMLVKVKGFVGSYIVNRPTTLSISLGGFVRGALASSAVPVTGFMHMADSSYAGVEANTSRCNYSCNRSIVCNWSQTPAFMAYDDSSGTMTARFQLAWGTITPYKNATNYESIF